MAQYITDNGYYFTADDGNTRITQESVTYTDRGAIIERTYYLQTPLEWVKLEFVVGADPDEEEDYDQLVDYCEWGVVE